MLSGDLIRRHSVPAFRQASNSGKWARMEGQNDNIFLLVTDFNDLLCLS
jgi:hypothetical protein